MQKCREQKVKIRERESNQEQPFQPRMKNIFTKKKKPHTHDKKEMTRINRNPIYYPQTQSPQSLKLYSQNKQTNKRKFDKKNFKNPAIEYEQVNKETCFSFENDQK